MLQWLVLENITLFLFVVREMRVDRRSTHNKKRLGERIQNEMASVSAVNRIFLFDKL